MSGRRLLSVVVGLVGCSSDASGAAQQAAAVLDVERQQIELPLDEFVMSEQEGNLVAHVNILRVAACLDERGLPHPAALRDWDSRELKHDRLFGPWNLDWVAEHGYDYPAAAESQEVIDASAALPAGYDEAHPECFAATEHLPVLTLHDDINLAMRGHLESYTSAQTQDEWTEAVEEWRACLRDGGYSISDEPDNFVPDLPSVFTLRIDTLPYRDLVTGDEGRDVAALQRALADLEYPVPETARFDAATSSALRQFYRGREHAAPGGTPTFVLAEFAAFAEGDPVVVSIPATNTVLASDATFVRLRTQPNVVRARVNLLEAEQFAVDDQVQVRGEGVDTAGTVADIGAFSESGTEGTAGVDVTVSVPPDVELLADQPYTVTTAGAIDEGPALPLSALRQKGGQVVVLVAGDQARTEVPVTVLVEGDGWVRIGDDPRLAVGTAVVVE